MSTAINHQYQYVFFHLPKNAGTSLSLVFGGNTLHGNKHYTPQDFLKEKGRDYYNSYYKIVFVRNPYMTLISNYFYMERQKSFHGLIPTLKDPMPFNYFIDWVCDNIDYTKLMTIEEEVELHKVGKPTNKYYTQYQWCSEKGSVDSLITLDFVGKVENIGDDVAKLRRRFFKQEYNTDVPKINISTSGEKIEDMYSKDMMRKVEDAFSIDFETFGYNSLC